MTQFNFFATTPKGLELLLVEELRALGAINPSEKLAGVTFTATLNTAYQACLWSRLANRILLTLVQVPAATPEALYAGAQSIQWDKHIHPEGTLAVHFVSNQSAITHTLYGAQKVKDAIVDQIRETHGVRPTVDRMRPDVCVYVHVYRDIASICIDLSGESLHKRGYRLAGGAAPLKENLAAGILLRAGWPAIAKEGGSLMDPMCGSGTLLIEGALMAGDVAPGLLRSYFGLTGWKQHQAALWQKLIEEAKQRRAQGIKNIPVIVGYDQDPAAIKIAFENIERAGMRGLIHVEKRELANFVPKQNAHPGLIVTNPPYGERLGEVEALKPLYTELGDRFKQACAGWQAAVFTGNPDLGKVMGVRSRKQYALFNGTLPCKLLLFDLQAENFIDRSPAAENERRVRAASRALASEAVSEALQMFLNRVRKNYKHARKQAQHQELTSYRIYDADLPDYPFAIDVTEKGVFVMEYEAPREIHKQKVVRKQQEILSALPELLGVSASEIHFSVLPRS